MNEPFLYSHAEISIETTDWHHADGAMLTADGEVVPMVDLKARLVEVGFTVRNDAEKRPSE